MFVKAAACLRAIASDRRAVTSLEYAIMAGMVAMAIIGAVSSLGNTLAASFNNVANNL